MLLYMNSSDSDRYAYDPRMLGKVYTDWLLDMYWVGEEKGLLLNDGLLGSWSGYQSCS